MDKPKFYPSKRAKNSVVVGQLVIRVGLVGSPWHLRGIDEVSFQGGINNFPSALQPLPFNLQCPCCDMPYCD